MPHICKVSDLPSIEQRAKEILQELKAKYPKLDAYLVYSSRFGQSNLGNKPEVLLNEFPQMFPDNPLKTRALKLLQERRKPALTKAAAVKNDNDLSQILAELVIDSTVQIELRFGQLDYEIVAQLQRDSLVDRTLTPQTSASIRIVIGVVGELFICHVEDGRT